MAPPSPSTAAPDHPNARGKEAEAVASETISISGDTRESFTGVEEQTRKQYRFVLPGPELTDQECAGCFAAIADMQAVPGFLVVSGSLPAAVPDDFAARVAQKAKARGAKVVVDASGPGLAAAVDEGLFLIKPNLRELQELVGAPLAGLESQLAAARSLAQKGAAEIVALTLGHRGGMVVTQHQAFYSRALPIEPISAVGAGDSFLGAMVWALDAGHGLEDAFRYGMAGGSAALLSVGTGLCQAHDVRRLYEQVRIERL